MEQQQEWNWTLEDIKGALMDDMRAIMQDELRQALVGLIPLLAPVLAATIVPVVKNPPANNDNARR